MDEYKIIFDKNNKNSLKIFKGDRLQTMIACPPNENGCDIINFEDTLSDGYTFDFGGFILITTNGERKLYHKGKLIAETK